MPSTSWITNYLRPNTDKGPNEFMFTNTPHYTCVNEVPYSGKTITAYVSGQTEAFDLSAADPAVNGTVTAITNRLRTDSIIVAGATTVGIRINLYNGAALIGTKEREWFFSDSVPTNWDWEFTGLTIPAVDLANLNAKIVSIGTAWNPWTGLIVLSEVDHIVTYTPTPTIVPQEIDLRSQIRDTIEVESLINSTVDMNSRINTEIEVVSEIDTEIDLRSPIRKEIELDE